MATSSLRLKKPLIISEELIGTGSGTSPMSLVAPMEPTISSGATMGFGFGDADAEETPREFFIRTAVDVEFGKENGDFIVKSASIERLVDWIIINKEDPVDSQSLLRCYPSVCDPLKFFTLFQNRLTNGTKEEKLRVLRFFQLWVEKYFQRDFINRKTNLGNVLCNRLLSVLLSTQWEDAQLRDSSNSVKLSILKTQARMKSGSTMSLYTLPKMSKLEISNLEKLTTDKKASRKLDDKLPEISLLELAGQLSKIEVRMFSRITERELYDLSWKKPANKHMCRHILRLIERTNNVSFWVATQILQADSSPGPDAAEKRCNRLKKFIKLAQKCLMLSNFNTLMEILGGLSLRPIQRLKQTWALLPEKYHNMWRQMEELMDNKHNYKLYRAEIKERKPPILPYLGVYLRDLTFIEEGNPSYVDKTHLINFQKMKMISAVISELQEYQLPNAYSGYFPNLRGKDRKFLKSGLVGISEDPLYDLSYKAEAQASQSMANINSNLLASVSLPTAGSGGSLSQIFQSSKSSDNLTVAPQTPTSAERRANAYNPPASTSSTPTTGSSLEETSTLQRSNSERSVSICSTPSPSSSPLLEVLKGNALSTSGSSLGATPTSSDL